METKLDFRTEYKSNLKHRYMVLIVDRAAESDDRRIAEQMWKGGGIPGLLTVRMMPLDQGMTYWYHITGLRSLAEYMEGRKLGGVFLAVFMDALKRLHETMLKYYLDERHLILDAERIYLNDSASEVYFCYEPDHEGALREMLRLVAEQMIERLDHQDDAAVAYGYAFYQQTADETADLWTAFSKIRREIATKDEKALAQYEKKKLEQRAELESLQEQAGGYEALREKVEEERKRIASEQTIPLKFRQICDIYVSRIRNFAKGGGYNGQNKIRLWKDIGHHLQR